MASNALPRIAVNCGYCGTAMMTTAGKLARYIVYCSAACGTAANEARRAGRARPEFFAPDKDVVPLLRERVCLACEMPFLSEGKHNRVCLRCKGCDAWQTGVDNAVHVPGRR